MQAFREYEFAQDLPRTPKVLSYRDLRPPKNATCGIAGLDPVATVADVDQADRYARRTQAVRDDDERG